MRSGGRERDASDGGGSQDDGSGYVQDDATQKKQRTESGSQSTGTHEGDMAAAKIASAATATAGKVREKAANTQLKQKSRQRESVL